MKKELDFYKRAIEHLDRGGKVYVVMLFETALSRGSNMPGVWVNTDNCYFTSPDEALLYYTDSDATWAELISASDEYELQGKMGDKILDMTDQQYLNENVYPYV